MVMPASGPLNMGGTSSPVSVAQELGLSLTATISMNQTNVRTLAGVSTTSGTTWSMSSLYGKSNIVPGTDWTYQAGLSSSAYGATTTFGIAINSSVYVAVGVSFSPVFTGKIATSSDGITWTNRTQLFTTVWGTSGCAAVAWSGTIFCVVGASGKCATSPDGVTWTYQAGLSATAWGTQHNGNQIIWTGTVFMAVGSGGRCATSPDGITWTYRAGVQALFGLSGVLTAVWNGSLFCIGLNGGGCATSPDAVTWTSRTLPEIGNEFSFKPDLHEIAWNGTVFCAVGTLLRITDDFDFIYFPSAVTSPDGVTWTYRSGLEDVVSRGPYDDIIVNSVSWNGVVFCAVGDLGVCATSPDGITWTYRAGLSATAWGTSNGCYAITTRNNTFYTVGQSGAAASSP